MAYTVGDRSQEGALSLRAHLPDGYRRRATRSDFWLAYGKSVFLPHAPFLRQSGDTLTLTVLAKQSSGVIVSEITTLTKQ